LSVGKCGVFGVRRPEENEPAAASAGEFLLAGAALAIRGDGTRKGRMSPCLRVP
jgi:hypothetical protein